VRDVSYERGRERKGYWEKERKGETSGERGRKNVRESRKIQIEKKRSERGRLIYTYIEKGR